LQEFNIMGDAHLSVKISGRVQGVFFRHFTCNAANRLGVRGYVRNLPDGNSVEIQAEGSREQLQSLLTEVRTGPPGAHVEEVRATWRKTRLGYKDFSAKY
jgi:acylphosphatase